MNVETINTTEVRDNGATYYRRQYVVHGMRGFYNVPVMFTGLESADAVISDGEVIECAEMELASWFRG